MVKETESLKSELAKLPEFLSLQDVDMLNEGRHPNPFGVLGPHKSKNRRWVVTVQPDAIAVTATVGSKQIGLGRIAGDVFAGPVAGAAYTLRMQYANGSTYTTTDPFAYASVLSDFDAYLLGEGTHRELWRVLGAHVCEHEGAQGTHFAVWAPNAQRVSVVGDFNTWDGRRHPMRRVGETGVWDIFLPDVGDGALYKYEVIGADGHRGSEG